MNRRWLAPVSAALPVSVLLLAFSFFPIPFSFAHAHPVPRRSHDRTIDVRLTTDPTSGDLLVRVSYRLEVDEFTVVFDDLPALADKVELGLFRKPNEFYDAFTRVYAPILAGNLLAALDNGPIEFTCAKRGHELRDENGTPLDHLRCDFEFIAKLPILQGSARPHRFTFKEGNYEYEEGRIRLSLGSDAPIRLVNKTEPDAALKLLPPTELKPGDDAKLRYAVATFTLGAAENEIASAPANAAKSEAAPVDPRAPSAADELPDQGHSLLALLLDSRQGFWGLMFLAACFGAAHALTPGHGKTLVAAYLVGEQGTFAHALLLGLVTTLTHTGAVFALVGILLFCFPQAVPQDVQVLFGLFGGLLVAGMGFWLLLRRLSGGADHFHLSGHGHHHHHHGHADHYHDNHGQAHPLPRASQPVGWCGLIVLGISGGIVPCWDAIVMVGFAVSAQRLWLGLPLLLAFSAGLASVLIAIGIGVVYVKGFASSRWGQSRVVRALPLLSAVLVMGMGLWLCYDSVHAPVIR